MNPDEIEIVKRGPDGKRFIILFRQKDGWTQKAVALDAEGTARLQSLIISELQEQGFK